MPGRRHPKTKQVKEAALKRAFKNLKTEDEVISFVNEHAYISSESRSDLKCRIKLSNTLSAAATDKEELVEKICKKKKIPTKKNLIKKKMTGIDKKTLISLSKQHVKIFIDFCEGKMDEAIFADELYTVRIKEQSIRDKYQPL